MNGVESDVAAEMHLDGDPFSLEPRSEIQPVEETPELGGQGGVAVQAVYVCGSEEDVVHGG
jgi:hypothetical protein